MSSIDAQLYRPLQSGNQFEGLIPAYQGSEHNFDKDTDNSTTYDTLRFMAQWSNKYAYQMKRIAPLLKGATMQETANKIYQFLYSHFQYKLDSSLQNLYSPSAAWHFRKIGFDCKTYSLLASCILQNLNITHSFRMVQQLGIMPGEWSHVYVIIPANNTEYVIDATTHSNKQVSYTKKHDYTMKHLGLASPAVYGLGCACQGKPITRNGLGAPGNLENTISNFHLFLNELEKKGIPKATTDKMLALVRYNVDNGIDPNMSEIVQKAILPAGQLGVDFSNYSIPNMNFGTPTPSYSLPSTSYNPSTPLYTSNIGSQPASGGSSFMQSGFATGVTSALSNVNVGGINAGGAISAVTGLLTGNPMALIGLVTSLIPIEKTFGAVFANGFDLSCWGASYSEQKAKLDIEKDIPFMAQWSGLDRAANTETYDRFLNITQAYLMDAQNGQQSKFAACTRKGHALRQKTIEELRSNTEQSFAKNGYRLVPNGTRKNQLTIQGGLPGYAAGKTFGAYQTTYNSFIVVQPTSQPQQQQQQQPQYQTIQNADGTTSQVPVANNESVKSSSSTTPLLIGGALLALKLLI